MITAFEQQLEEDFAAFNKAERADDTISMLEMLGDGRRGVTARGRFTATGVNSHFIDELVSAGILHEVLGRWPPAAEHHIRIIVDADAYDVWRCAQELILDGDL